MIYSQILCLGDSLTFGARDRYGRSYPAELAKFLSDKTGEFYFCHNHGINGETSSDLIRRAWPIISSNQESKIILLWIGTNDTKIPTPEKIYEDNISKIINISKVFGMTPIVGTVPNFGFNPFYLHNADYVEKYNNVIEKLSKDLKFITCDMSGLEEFLIDGVHYNHEGNKEIAKRWMSAIFSVNELG